MRINFATTQEAAFWSEISERVEEDPLTEYDAAIQHADAVASRSVRALRLRAWRTKPTMPSCR